MKKILGILVLGLLLNIYTTTASSFSKQTGQGELKLTKDAFDLIEFYFSAGQYGNIKNNPTRDWQKELIKNKAWKGMFLILSKNAKGRFWYYSIYRDDQTDPANYLGKARIKCEKQGHGECFVFAKGNKIIWQNGINPKKGTKIKKEEAINGMVSIKLKELGFYSDTRLTTTTPKITKKKEEPKKVKKSADEDKGNIVSQIKDLKKLLDDGVITQDEFDKAKKKLLN
jgi:hypothetical protein